MTQNPHPPLLARLSGPAWVCAALLLIAGAVCIWDHYRDLAFISRVALSLESGPNMSEEGRLRACVNFTHNSIRKNRKISDVPTPLARLYYKYNPLHPGAADVLRWGAHQSGGCGSHSRVVVALLQAAGLKARPLIILDSHGRSTHTTVETSVNGKWVVADALYGIVFTRRDGQLASAAEVAADTANFLAQVRDVPGYDIKEYNYDHVTLLNWGKIPVILPAIRRVLVMAIGEQRVGQMVRPSIWMWPALFYGVTALCLSVLCAAVALAGRAARRRWAASRPATA
jgi:hypothetical protein